MNWLKRCWKNSNWVQRLLLLAVPVYIGQLIHMLWFLYGHIWIALGLIALPVIGAFVIGYIVGNNKINKNE